MENKKIIVIDHANIMHKAIFAFRNNYSVPATFTYCAMIIGYLKKIGFNSKEDEVILAIDYGKSWRKLEDPTYKKQRKAIREEIESPEWWAEMYGEFNNFLPILEKALPWYFVKLYNIEADDIASVCCRYYKDNEIILISADNDWTMLCHYSNVKVFSPYNKKYKIIKNPMKVLLEKIQGDISDNLLTKPSSEREFERRKKIVNLLELPIHIETEIRKQFDKFTPKGINLYKIKFKTIRERFAQLYKLQGKFYKEKNECDEPEIHGDSYGDR